MSRGILALYDTTEIQKYVYSSSKLKDNIGASELVDKCFSTFLKEVIKKECGDKAKVEWEEDRIWTFEENKELVAEIVYIGGGNALVAYDSKDTWKNINYEFGLELFKEAKGLNFVTVCTEITGKFGNDIDKLFTDINNKKYGYKRMEGVKGLSITKECAITKNVAVGLSEKVAVSYEVLKKREKSNNDESNKVLDDIAGNKGESYIAVVHIDGNNMGKKVESIINNQKKYGKAIEKLRGFSIDIQKAYDNAYNRMENEFKDIIFNSDDSNELIKEYKEMFSRGNRKIVPFRKILIKGDDVTYISYGKIGITSLEAYFKFLKEELNKNKTTKNLNACGGIAFVKPHFPFSRAYEIAEECCANAKTVAKQIDKDNVGYYFDFHIVRGTMMGTLDEVRKRQYSTYDYSEVNLLHRPFAIENTRKAIVFKDVKELIEQLKEAKMPRNKVKELRDSFLYGDEEVKLAISKMESRGINITYKNEKIFKIENGARIDKDIPLFDAIEFMELYDDLLKLGGNK